MTAVTPAMVRRCRQLTEPGAELLYSGGSVYWRAGASSSGGGWTFVMADKLRAAGLIVWAPILDGREQQAQLTDFGRAIVRGAEDAALRRRAMQIEPRTP
jgi:hypothetical protein